MAPKTKTHMNRREAADYLGLSEATLAKWGVLNRGPKFVKLGIGRSARVRYAIEDLDAFLRNGGRAL